MGNVHTIPESAMDYVLYGDKTHVIADYLRNRLANVPQALSPIAERIYGAVSQSYRYVTDTLTRHGILNRLTNQGAIAGHDFIRNLTTFEQLQQATPVMQRWVMAHETIRKLYLDQNIDGYSGSYSNVFGNGVGENDYNWRRIMSGVPQENENGAYIRFYNDNLLPGDREPSHSEKVCVLTTYDYIDHMLKSNPYDFTLTSEALTKINWE